MDGQNEEIFFHFCNVLFYMSTWLFQGRSRWLKRYYFYVSLQRCFQKTLEFSVSILSKEGHSYKYRWAWQNPVEVWLQQKDRGSITLILLEPGQPSSVALGHWFSQFRSLYIQSKLYHPACMDQIMRVLASVIVRT